MEVTIDEYGRIVIPKSIRDRLGLEGGSSLELDVDSDDDAESIRLTPTGQRPPLQQKGSLLVHTGRLTDEHFDIVEQIREHRRGRAREHAGLQT